MTRWLPFCFLLVLGLMSCQQEEEIIPLETDDLVDDKIKNPTSFDTLEATGVVIDKDGEIIAYYDKELNLFNEKGISLSNSRGTNIDGSIRTLAILYDGPFFRGQYYIIATSSVNHTGVFNLSNIGWANRAESMVVAPDVLAQLQDFDVPIDAVRKNYGDLNGEPHYYEELPGIYNKSDWIFFNWNRYSPNTDKMCGMLYQYSNFSVGGAKIPFFKDQELDLSSLGSGHYDYTNMSSLASNDNSVCDGVMLYEDADDVDQGYAWFHPDRDDGNIRDDALGEANIPDVGTVRRGLKKVNTVSENSPYAYHFTQTKFQIGAVFYKEENFKGEKLIFPAGKSYKKKKAQEFPIKSMVVAPGQTFYIRDKIGYAGHREWQASQDQALYLNSINNESFLQGFTAEVTNISQDSYCGAAYKQNPNDPNGRYHTLPIFNEINNSDALPLSRFLNQWDNEINYYLPNKLTAESSNCKGVTFWKDYIGYETSRRRWVGTGTNLVNFKALGNKISAISTEGCTESSVSEGLISKTDYNDIVDRYNQLASSNNRMLTTSGLNFFVQSHRTQLLLLATGTVLVGEYFSPGNYYSTAVGTGVCLVGLHDLFGTIQDPNFQVMLYNQQFARITNIAYNGMTNGPNNPYIHWPDFIDWQNIVAELRSRSILTGNQSPASLQALYQTNPVAFDRLMNLFPTNPAAVLTENFQNASNEAAFNYLWNNWVKPQLTAQRTASEIVYTLLTSGITGVTSGVTAIGHTVKSTLFTKPKEAQEDTKNRMLNGNLRRIN